jgi:glycine C-acetyltransferase
MYGSMKDHLARQLAQIEQGGLTKPERVITSPQSNRITTAAGQSVLNMCANNYLGLADHPEVIRAYSICAPTTTWAWPIIPR